MRNWSTIEELAGHLIARGHASRTVRLSSETALLVGLKLMTAEVAPTHQEVVKIICDSKCERPCVPCTFKANAIVRAYGQRSAMGRKETPADTDNAIRNAQ